MKSIDRHSPTAWFAVMSSSKLHLNGIQTKWDRIQLWWPQSPIVVKPEEDNAHAQIILCDRMSAEKKGFLIKELPVVSRGAWPIPLALRLSSTAMVGKGHPPIISNCHNTLQAVDEGDHAGENAIAADNTSSQEFLEFFQGACQHVKYRMCFKLVFGMKSTRNGFLIFVHGVRCSNKYEVF